VGCPEEGGGDSSVIKKARLLAKHQGPIPFFLKQATNAWLFDGHYRAKGVVEDRAYLDRKQRKANRSDVVLVLQLEPVEVVPVTYLLTWNPHNRAWDDLEQRVGLTADTHFPVFGQHRPEGASNLFLRQDAEIHDAIRKERFSRRSDKKGIPFSG
jgi:hypothetical protein